MHNRRRNLPNKSIRLLQYALSSPCNFTHIGKVDDDVFLRPNRVSNTEVLAWLRPETLDLG